METEVGIWVTAEFEEGQDNVPVYIDINEFAEMDKSEQIEYIERMTKEQYSTAKEVYVTDEDLIDIQCSVNDILDTSDSHPNETYEEFMEHENFD